MNSDFAPVHDPDPDPVNDRYGHVAAVWHEVTLLWGGAKPERGNINFKSPWDPAVVLRHQDGVWTSKTTYGQVPPPLFGAAAEVVGNNLYVMCGVVRVDKTKTNDIYKLDLISWTWSKLDPKGTKLLRSAHMRSWVCGERIFLFGGWGGPW